MPKQKVAIVTDSTANIPDELLKKYGDIIHVIPQIINWDGQSLLDGIDITPADFYTRLAASRELPTTSQPSTGEFFDFFSKVSVNAESIVGIFLSEFLSGTLACATQAAEMMEGFPIEVVDSRTTSTALGLIVASAAQAVADGQDYQAVAELARTMSPKARIIFVVDTLEYLHRGGRIGGAKRLVGSVLSIKPVLHLVDGKIEPLASVRTKKKAIAQMLETVVGELSGKTKVRTAVIHASAPNEAQAVRQQAQELITSQGSYQVELSPVIGVHVGPGTVGLAYVAED